VAVSRLRICDVDPYCKVKEDNNNTSTFFYLERIKFEIKVKSVNVHYQMMEMLLKKARYYLYYKASISHQREQN
jgi:hypothetical protein